MVGGTQVYYCIWVLQNNGKTTFETKIRIKNDENVQYNPLYPISIPLCHGY